MRRAIVALLLVALGLGALATSGCHDYNKDFNAAITRVSQHVKAYESMEASVQAAATQLNSIRMTPKGARDAMYFTARIKEQIGAQKAELAAAASDLRKIKGLDVKEEMKKYADLEIAWVKAQTAVLDAEIALFDQMDVTYKAIKDGRGTGKEIQKSQARMNELSATIGTLSEAAAKAQKAAADYFKGNVTG